MKKYTTVIIGGGAAGICAAISQARKSESVVICEKTSQIGKKILASGNGRCNLLNEDLRDSNYNPASRELVRSIFSQFGKDAIGNFFKNLGLEIYSKEGRFFPVTNQAASVWKVLDLELKRLAVPVEFNFECNDLSFSGSSIIVSSRSGEKIECRNVVLAGGGKTYPAYGSDGSLYEIASRLGHTLIEPVPAAVPLVVKDNLCQVLQGQRISVTARAIIQGRTAAEASGELLFTQYGLSGTCILDISEEISIALHRYHQTEVSVEVDLVPFLSDTQLELEQDKRQQSGWLPEDRLTGLLPNKFGPPLKNLFENRDSAGIVKSLKHRRFKVNGTRGWNEAEFTSGGINVKEVDAATLESKIRPGVYFAGEILDVAGRRGGYNLGWAWASGFIAGQTNQSS